MPQLDLNDLLTIMRRMYVAATQGDWSSVDALDQERQLFLDQVQEFPSVKKSFNRAAVREIIELDLEVMQVASTGLELVAKYAQPAAVSRV